MMAACSRVNLKRQFPIKQNSLRLFEKPTVFGESTAVCKQRYGIVAVAMGKTVPMLSAVVLWLSDAKEPFCQIMVPST